MTRKSAASAERDRQIRRLGTLSKGGPIAAGLAVIGLGLVAAISYPGKTDAAQTTGSGSTGATSSGTTSTRQATPAPALTPPAQNPFNISFGGGGHVSSGGS